MCTCSRCRCSGEVSSEVLHHPQPVHRYVHFTFPIWATGLDRSEAIKRNYHLRFNLAYYRFSTSPRLPRGCRRRFVILLAKMAGWLDCLAHKHVEICPGGPYLSRRAARRGTTPQPKKKQPDCMPEHKYGLRIVFNSGTERLLTGSAAMITHPRLVITRELQSKVELGESSNEEFRRPCYMTYPIIVDQPGPTSPSSMMNHQAAARPDILGRPVQIGPRHRCERGLAEPTPPPPLRAEEVTRLHTWPGGELCWCEDQTSPDWEFPYMLLST